MTGRLHHLQIEAEVLQGNGGLGRYVLVPGSVDRCARVGARLEDLQVVQNRRRLDVHLGRLEMDGQSIDVAAIPTGMGCPSVDIVVGELLHAGVRRMLRIGTAGSMQDGVKIGDLVIATGAVRDEAASDAYCPREVPATADPLWVEALSRAAQALKLDERAHVGLLHSKDSFFGREFGEGPNGAHNRDYMERLRGAGVLASEMEAAHLFVLGQVFGHGSRTVAATRSAGAKVRCGAMCAIVGDTVHGFATLEEEQAAEDRLVELALKGIATLHAMES
ncbi:MAG: nucleoside phosphorylase [Alphaproteobacteria bacterium]|nr:nucleoside phosphorylase [Alphaproteobacteria bacterium]MCB9696886.1 nucleoside phosphorylase [Alphaproteobacteria bacterium]